jgi:hypothetical protein
MVTDQGPGGEIGRTHRPSYLWATYPPCYLRLHTYLSLLIGHLPSYPKVTYGLPTYLPKLSIQGLPRELYKDYLEGI